MRFLFLFFLVIFNVGASFFEIRNVEVKEEGVNSLEAKNRALNVAIRHAFRRVVDEYFGVKIPPRVSIHQIQNCLYDYSIDQEKCSDRCYIASISHRFHRYKIMSLLRERGVNVVLEEEKTCTRNARLAVRLHDFLRHTKRLRDLEVTVENFSNRRVVFLLPNKYMNDFLKLRIKYALII
ncbi:MAG: hypothetical protein LBG20_04410 [Holosporaceae bacterium]|jgi:hypothetical protein|nr:hypothetical protein [Holosporaceae bacterium]